MRVIRFFLLIGFFFLFSAISRPPILISPYQQQSNSSTATDSSLVIPTEKPEEEKEKIPTTWGANTLTQEQKEIDGLEVTVFTLQDGAWIQHKSSRLSSNRIQIVGKDAVKGSLKGGVRVSDPKNRIYLYARSAEYDKYEEEIDLRGRPRLIYYDKEKRRTKITAERIKRFMAQSKTILYGRVLIENRDYVILTDSAVFYESRKTLQMDNYPFIFGKSSFLTAEKVLYNSETNRNELIGHASFFRYSYEKKNKSNPLTDSKDRIEPPEQEVEKQKILTIFSGNKLIYQGGEGNNSYIGMFGNAKLFRPDAEFTAEYVKAFGDKKRDIEAKNGVRFYDKENSMILYGDNFEHKNATKYTHLTENARIDFLQKGKEEVNATLYAVEIERFGDRKEIVARGNLSIQSENATAYGEYATFSEQEKKLVVEGNPRLKRKNKILYCGKIVLYPQLNRAFITDGIRVKSEKKNNAN